MDIFSYKLGKSQGGGGGGGGVTREELIEALATKQDTLIEGTNIKIENSTISSNQETAKNPEALTFGDETYDGSVAKEITADKIGAATKNLYIHGEMSYDEESEEEKIVVTDAKYLNEDGTLNAELLFADISAATSPFKEVFFVIDAEVITKLPLSYFMNDGSGDSRALFETIINNANVQISIALSGEITLTVYDYTTATMHDYTLVFDEDNGNHFIDKDNNILATAGVFYEILGYVLERNNTNVFINVVFPDPEEGGYTPVVARIPYVLIDADNGDGLVFGAKYRDIEVAISMTAERITGEIIENAGLPDRFEVTIDMETLSGTPTTNPRYGKEYSSISDLFNYITGLIDHNKQVIAVSRFELNDEGDYGYFEFPMLAAYYNSANEHSAVLFNQIIGDACYELQISSDKIELEIREFAEG